MSAHNHGSDPRDVDYFDSRREVLRRRRRLGWGQHVNLDLTLAVDPDQAINRSRHRRSAGRGVYWRNR